MQVRKKIDIILAVALVAGFLVYKFNLISLKFGLPLLMVIAVLGAVPIVFSALRSLKNKKISVDFLAAIALVASFFLKEWSSAIFINLMLVSARILDSYSKDRAGSAIKSLLKLRPQKVRVKKDGDIVKKNAHHVQKGEFVIIESGERIPADGTIISGEASIDQSSLTGESVPVLKRAGERVLSSTLIVSGSLVVEAKKVGKDTMFERIINLVEGAHQAKTEINSIAERFTSRYVIITLAGSAIIYWFFKDTALLLSILLVACADDIAVAIPMAFLISIGRAAKQGIIVKGNHFLETLTRVKKIIVDKTGTLTWGKLGVERIISFGQHDREEIMRLAATAEFFSNHSAAKAIVNQADKEKIRFKKPEIFEEFPGGGITADYENKKIIVGKFSFLKEHDVVISDDQMKIIDGVKKDGLTATLVGYSGELFGFIALADQIRPEVPKTVAMLKKEGIGHWIMLTGDNEEVARKIANQAGINEYHANLLPENKLDFVKKHLSEKSKLAMVGDGVNDAAALALADIGIAMGAIGSDAAIEAADIALMKDDFSKIPEMIKIGKNTMRISYQNFWIWGIVNIIGFILVFAHFMGPQGAAAYNFVTDFFPLINSARLFRE